MKRRIVLGTLVVVGALSIAIAAQQPPQARVVEVEKLKDNLYVLKGGGGNTAVFITANGVVVVDAKNPGWGQPILDKIKTLTDKSVTTLINTHTHGDHVSGNVEFPATVEVVTHVVTGAAELRPNQERRQRPGPGNRSTVHLLVQAPVIIGMRDRPGPRVGVHFPREILIQKTGDVKQNILF